jgi:hypothetical protein
MRLCSPLNNYEHDGEGNILCPPPNSNGLDPRHQRCGKKIGMKEMNCDTTAAYVSTVAQR